MAVTGPAGVPTNVRVVGEALAPQSVEHGQGLARAEGVPANPAANPSMATPQMQRAVDPGQAAQLVLPSVAPQKDAAPDSDFRAAMAPLAKLLNNPALKAGAALPGAAAFLANIPTLGAIASAAYALWHFARFVQALLARGKLRWGELAKAGGHTAAAFAAAAGAPLASTVAFLADIATTDDEEWSDDGLPRKKREPTESPVPELMA